jgi:RimJ/RimL family protein N-acetyltransferase
MSDTKDDVRMKLNEGVIIEGARCLLVPYTKDLVEQYHSWFVEDPELLRLTGSELLTLEEEYINQESWREDQSKLTFLIRDIVNITRPLCGDINAFFSDFFESDWEDMDGISETPSGLVAEINLMIARQESRRKGIAREAITTFTDFILKSIKDVRILVAKIQIDNDASIKLFESLGYHEFKRIACFNEVHLVKFVS